MFSSERLGPLDALLLNMWLEGDLRFSLKYLYDHILPFGGLGTYRWLQYFKTQRRGTFELIGLDVDTFDKNEKLLSLLKKISTKDFGDQLTLDWMPPMRKSIKNKIDKVIHYALVQFQEEQKTPTNRLKMWAKNINQVLNERPRDCLFVNGFHLSRHDSGLLTNLRIPRKDMLVIGMSSVSREIPVVELTRAWFKKQKLEFPDDYGTPKFWGAYVAYYDTLTPLQIKKVLNQNIKPSSEVVEPTPFEKNCGKHFKLIPTKRNEFDYIDHSMGGMAEPFVKKVVRVSDGGFKVSDYDYVVCTPHSSYRRDMRY